jgi:hypothetical protein
MNDDPLLSRLRDLPSPKLSERTRSLVGRRAEAEMIAARRAWPVWALSALLLLSESVYVVEVIAKMRFLFG